jgi:nitrate reductase alpha subunit
VAVKAWQALGEFTGREHTHLALNKEDEKIRFRDIQAQPRKIISSPTWSGLESEHVSYNAGYTNVHELIPWRTLRPPAAVSGSSLDARLWRKPGGLSSAH